MLSPKKSSWQLSGPQRSKKLDEGFRKALLESQTLKHGNNKQKRSWEEEKKFMVESANRRLRKQGKIK